MEIECGGKSVSHKEVGPRKGGDHHWPAPKVILPHAQLHTMRAPIQATVMNELRYSLFGRRLQPMDDQGAGGRLEKENVNQKPARIVPMI